MISLRLVEVSGAPKVDVIGQRKVRGNFAAQRDMRPKCLDFPLIAFCTHSLVAHFSIGHETESPWPLSISSCFLLHTGCPQ